MNPPTSIYLIDELLDYMKGLILLIQNYRISMTQGYNRVSEKNRSEVPVLIEFPKPEASNQTKSLQ